MADTLKDSEILALVQSAPNIDKVKSMLRHDEIAQSANAPADSSIQGGVARIAANVLPHSSRDAITRNDEIEVLAKAEHDIAVVTQKLKRADIAFLQAPPKSAASAAHVKDVQTLDDELKGKLTHLLDDQKLPLSRESQHFVEQTVLAVDREAQNEAIASQKSLPKNITIALNQRHNAP